MIVALGMWSHRLVLQCRQPRPHHNFPACVLIGCNLSPDSTHRDLLLLLPPTLWHLVMVCTLYSDVAVKSGYPTA